MLFYLLTFTRVVLLNLWLDLAHFGLIGTLKYRMNLTPSKQTIEHTVNYVWNFMRKIPVPPLQNALDKEKEKVISVLSKPNGQH